VSKPPSEFAQYCCDLLASVGPCAARRMFGGYGISTEGVTLAIMADLGSGEKLWLKADETSQSAFQQAGCEPFVFHAKEKTMRMNYFSAPDEVMESPALMAPWARLALEAALKARLPKPVAKAKPAAKTRPPAKAKTSSTAAAKPRRKAPPG